MIIFFEHRKHNGVSETHNFFFPQQKGRLKMWGNWDGATLELQVRNPPQFNEVWLPCFDSFGVQNKHIDNISTPLSDFIPNVPMRVELTNAGVNTNLFCTIEQTVG